MSSSIRAISFTPPSALETKKLTSHYEVLRVKRDASPLQIKLAYRSLAKMYHPDASEAVSDGKDFIEIYKAYETLSDPVARNVYDLSLSVGSGRRMFGRSYVNDSRFYKGQRWETDQCW
ncbi:chaperone protein dnaJ 11, chloroplastic-like [Impatiens glandulifera]|uniref:chaperone protein dnaJ 11, chloroplastic-like n=1 Tax=Impatiens glandulifera TaxID=253017 RepID=UPI001FB15F68|nr:chaperone protein dnaJ 11, chloroplastic-like [Impatiens glandulifera]